MPTVDDCAIIILAAGQGQRLLPLTHHQPKALCPIAGVPLIDLALRNAAQFLSVTPTTVAVNVHHHATRMRAHLGDRVHISDESANEALGTAGALAFARPWLAGRHAIVINADVYLHGHLADLLTSWDGKNSRLLTTATAQPSDFGYQRYVGVSLISARHIATLATTPTGLYEVLWRNESAVGTLELHPWNGTAIDCGTPTDYWRANMIATQGRGFVDPAAQCSGQVTESIVWPGAVVHSHENLHRVIRAGNAQQPITLHVGEDHRDVRTQN